MGRKITGRKILSGSIDRELEGRWVGVWLGDDVGSGLIWPDLVGFTLIESAGSK
jgi:hypothetical protein